MIRKWLQRRRCLHHDRRAGYSYIKERLIDAGARKLLWCESCYKTWII